MFYSLSAIVGLLVLVILNYDILFNRKYKPRRRQVLKAYRFFLWSIAFYLITDVLWGCLNILEDKTAVSIDTTIYFIGMALALFAWALFVTRYIEDNKIFKSVLTLAGAVIALFGFVLSVINFFVPVLFSYNETVYVPKFWRYLFLGLQIILFIVSSLYAVIVAARNDDKKKKRHLVAIAAYGTIMSIAIGFQLYHPDYPVYALGCTIGIVYIHIFLVMEEKTNARQDLLASEKETASMKELAYIDSLTGAKNKHAFVELEQKYDELIHDGKIDAFALLIFDLNNLKNINDQYGHETGDKYIIKSCKLIEEYFPGVDIYRYGGDEFVLILEGEKYENRYQKLDEFTKTIEKNAYNNEPVVAVGLSDFIKEKDNTLRTIFLRADDRMYSHKRRLKQLENDTTSDLNNKSMGGISAIEIRYEMYEMFYRNSNVSLIDMLNASNCDELLEVDVKNDSFKQFFHVKGKYLAPATSSSYQVLLESTCQYVVHPDDRGEYEGLMKIDGFFERLKNARIPNFDFAHFRYKLQDGTYRYVEQVVIAGEEYGIPDGMFRMYVFDINNIKSRQSGNISEDGLSISVGRDANTGLLTGKEFFQSGAALVQEHKDKKWCFVSADIEHFKFFNEWFGREKGDSLLAKIGAELRAFEDSNDAVAGYFGGDDFVLLMEYDMDKIHELFNKIHEHINSFGFSAGFLPAFGIALLDKGMVLVDAFDRSTIAVSKAKKNLKDRIVIYDENMQFLAEHESRVLTDFIHALQNDEITFYLQPQCHLETGKIVGVEALARWIKPDGKVISPAEFIPILEKYGFITDLDKAMWEKACLSLKRWIDGGHKSVPISLNVSQIDIFNLDICEYFANLCKKHGIPSKLIKIEITESAYAESVDIVDKLVRDLRKNGFMVIMDDFGSGYSSLNMLSTLKLDAIKLDAKFLNIESKNHEKGIHILETIVNMVKTMSVPFVVEGVETKNQCDFLKELGCQYVQGFYFYKPMPREEYERLALDEKKLDSRGFLVKRNEQFRLREFLDENVYSDAMLNSILGPVAIYTYDKDRVDIVRFNQQFYEAVNVPDFKDRLENIQQFVPNDEERAKLYKALKEAKNNRLTGASETVKFYRTNGTLSCFKMLFYYLGKKDKTDRFYGSVEDVTDLEGLKEAKGLIAKYSKDNIIFVNRILDKWTYNVASHALSDDLGLSPAELEEELNNGKFAERVSNKKELKEFMKFADNKDSFPLEHVFIINTKSKTKIKIAITIDYVGDEYSSVEYILKSNKVE